MKNPEKQGVIQAVTSMALPAPFKTDNRRTTLTGHNAFMMVCCAAMVLGTAILFLSVPAGQSLGQTLMLAAPMLSCLGMHFVMHRFMGKACHASSKKEKQSD